MDACNYKNRRTMCWTEDRDVAVFDMEDTRRDLGQHYRYATESYLQLYLRVQLSRFSLFTLVFVVAAFACYFAVIAWGTRNPLSIAGWLIESLGAIYGTAIYATGFSTLFVAIRSALRSTETHAVAIVMPFTLVPTMIGTIAMLHGYIFMNRVIASSPSYPKHSDTAYAHAFSLTPMLVGLCFTTASFTILCITLMLRGRSPSPSKSAEQ